MLAGLPFSLFPQKSFPFFSRPPKPTACFFLPILAFALASFITSRACNLRAQGRPFLYVMRTCEPDVPDRHCRQFPSEAGFGRTVAAQSSFFAMVLGFRCDHSARAYLPIRAGVSRSLPALRVVFFFFPLSFYSNTAQFTFDVFFPPVPPATRPTFLFPPCKASHELQGLGFFIGASLSYFCNARVRRSLEQDGVPSKNILPIRCPRSSKRDFFLFFVRFWRPLIFCIC